MVLAALCESCGVIASRGLGRASARAPKLAVAAPLEAAPAAPQPKLAAVPREDAPPARGQKAPTRTTPAQDRVKPDKGNKAAQPSHLTPRASGSYSAEKDRVGGRFSLSWTTPAVSAAMAKLTGHVSATGELTLEATSDKKPTAGDANSAFGVMAQQMFERDHNPSGAIESIGEPSDLDAVIRALQTSNDTNVLLEACLATRHLLLRGDADPPPPALLGMLVALAQDRTRAPEVGSAAVAALGCLEGEGAEGALVELARGDHIAVAEEAVHVLFLTNDKWRWLVDDLGRRTSDPAVRSRLGALLQRDPP